MRFRMDFSKLPRCGAKARSNSGNPCRHVALKNGRCHYHGGKALTKHGHYLRASKIERSRRRAFISEMRQSIRLFGDFINEKS